MTDKKLIPCRICGKPFKPCSYCQSHADVFRWRNFACSRECATKYINETIAYRESLKNKNVSDKNEEIVNEPIIENNIENITTTITTKKKSTKKNLTTVVENEIKNNETE